MDAWVWWVVAAGAGIFLADVAFRAAVLPFVLPIFERRPPFNVLPADRDADAESVRFPTTDGLTLAGSLILPHGEPLGVVVFCPEFGGSHWSASAYAGALTEAGFVLFGFDFRNQGESDAEPGYSPSHWLTEREVADALAALRYVAERPDLAGLPIAMFGISRGGNAALAASARTPAVQAVATEGAFSTDGMMLFFAFRWAELYVPRWVMRLLPEWHLAGTMRFARRVSALRHGVRYTVLERWLPRLAGRPILLITGEKDSYVTPPIVERLRERIGRSCLPLWIVPGAKHNLARSVAPQEYDRRITDFFVEKVAGPRRESRGLTPAGR